MHLRTFREKHQKRFPSIASLARAIGVTPQAVGRYECGKRIPGREVMERIREITNGQVTPDDFYAASPTAEGE